MTQNTTKDNSRDGNQLSGKRSGEWNKIKYSKEYMYIFFTRTLITMVLNLLQVQESASWLPVRNNLLDIIRQNGRYWWMDWLLSHQLKWW